MPERESRTMISSGLASIPLLGALDAHRRGGERLQALDRDELAAVLASAVVAFLDARERPVDRLDLGLAALVEAGEQAAHVLFLGLGLELRVHVLVELAELAAEAVDLVQERASAGEQGGAERFDRLHGELMPGSRRWGNRVPTIGALPSPGSAHAPVSDGARLAFERQPDPRGPGGEGDAEPSGGAHAGDHARLFLGVDGELAELLADEAVGEAKGDVG